MRYPVFSVFRWIFLFSCMALEMAACTNKPILPPPSPCRGIPSYLSAASHLRVVGVFTTWSLSSQAQWSRFMRLFTRYDSKNVQFFAVFTDPDRNLVDEWVRSEKPPFTVIHDPSFFLCGRPVREVPFTYFLDAHNRVCLAYSGHATSDRLSKQIQLVLQRCARLTQP